MAETSKKKKKKPGPKKGEGGAPVKKFDKELFLKYLKYMATQQEICDYFDCDHKTLTKWVKREFGMTYSQVFKKNQSFTKLNLRRKQIETAFGRDEYTEHLPNGGKIVTKGLPPNPMMQVWLGKQYLGQTDQPVDESARECYTELPSLTQDKDSSDD